MANKRFILFVAATLAVLLPASLPAAGQQVLSGHVPDAVASSQAVSALAPATRLDLAIGLPLRNQEELDALLPQLSDPTSPNFRHYLTPEEFTAEFGPTKEDYEAVIEFAREKGLTVTETHTNRMLVDVSGTVPDVENAFQVKMMSYKHPVRGEYYAPDREPVLDLATPVLAISGLNNFVVPRPMDLETAVVDEATPFVTGSGPYGLFIGKDFRAAYAPGVTLTGSGQAVGLFELDGFFPGDVTRNATAAGLPAVPTQTVLVDNYNGAAGWANIEVILDIMMASYMAPGLSKVMVYEGVYPNDVLNRMATDNAAKQLSSSWGFPIDATTEQIYKEFISQGQSLLQASGDDGAYKNGVMTPSDDPNLTIVGGTSLTTSGAGGPWAAESAWSGSGGGFSTTYKIPSYQQGMSMAACGGSTAMRNLPDVALTADIQMYLIFNNGVVTSVGGTSAAAPLWAGFIALANQQAAGNSYPSIGFLNPPIYEIGNSSRYASDFHDIIHGNTGYPAVTGYDLTTGWGSPAGQPLINDLTDITGAPAFELSSSASALTMGQSSSGTVTITVEGSHGFNSTVTLAASGLPAGVTAAFSPASTASSSTVTFTASASTKAGNYTITIKGTSGNLTSSTVMTMTVVSPSFSLTASVASLVVNPGHSGTSTITITGQYGFDSSVSLAASGLPSGVTAAFTPASATTTSTVTFTASASAKLGTVTITIKGTSGSLTASTTIALVVEPQSFSLAASAATLTVHTGNSGTSTISVTGLYGFSGSVSLAATGLPSGVTAAFSPASTATTSTVTFTVSASAAGGTYALTIKGTSGALSGTAALALTVVTPSFTLAASPSSLVISQVSSESTLVYYTGQNGFSGAVNYAVTSVPAGLTATLTPGNFTNTVLLAVSGSGVAATIGAHTVTVTGTSGTLKSTVNVTVNVIAPVFFVDFDPAELSMAQGETSGGTVFQVAEKGVQNVTLSASGLPAGFTASFSAWSGPLVMSQATFTASSTVPAGKYTITLKGTASGGVTASGKFTLIVQAPTSGTTLVNLSPAYNISALVTDGLPFSGGGMDGGVNGVATAYSADYLAEMEQYYGSILGTIFTFGPANAPDAVSGGTVTLPAGKFSAIKLLATGVNGSQPAQSFKVSYTDGTSSVFTQNLSDWYTPQHYGGETIAMPMTYRDTASGGFDVRFFYLYEYTFALNSSKTVASITLPNNRNVVILAATLTNAASSVRTNLAHR